METLRVQKKGDEVSIRSAFCDGLDLIIEIGKGNNGQINFCQARLTGRETPERGILIHDCGDDAAPWRINGTFIGGNHGCSDVLEITTTRHGRTTMDLGSEWHDASGRKFYLIGIVSAETLRLLSENLETPPLWKFRAKACGNVLTRNCDGQVLSVVSQKAAQLRPACRINDQQFLIEGRIPIEEGCVTECRHFEIIEEYDILNPGSLLDDTISHPGIERNFAADHLEAVIRQRTVYRFFPNGSNVIESTAKALQNFHLEHAGFVQAAKLSCSDQFPICEYYIPKTKAFEQDGVSYDFSNVQNFTESPAAPIDFNVKGKSVEDSGNPPDRFVQFLGSPCEDGICRKVGFAMGYSLLHGITRREIRTENIEKACMLYTTGKTYPRAVEGMMGMVSAGNEFRCTAYRHYFFPPLHPHATCAHWHAENDVIILHVDYHRRVERDVIKLPPHFAGRGILTLEKTPSIVLHSESVAAGEGLVISVDGPSGYVTLKI